MQRATIHPRYVENPKTPAIQVAGVFVFRQNDWMTRTYRYVGPAQLAKLAHSTSLRIPLRTADEVQQWRAGLPKMKRDETLTVTFVVLHDGLWIADRQSEHVACARGTGVLSAGELTFALHPNAPVEVVAATNQSTGYCPEPESWLAVEHGLESAGIPHPGQFTTAMTFRRCQKCGTTNIVKDGWFYCAVCNAELPAEWNFAY